MKAKSLLSLLVLASCATGERVDGDSADRQGDALDSIPQHPNTSACSGGTYHCYALVRTDGMGDKRAAGGSGFGPPDLASAYKLNTALNPGATIAIVDAFNYANAESDLAAYRSAYGLPACTSAHGCFKRVNQNGQTSPLPGNAPAGDDWTVEAALDVDLA